MGLPLISVIIPVFNREKCIEKCLESIIRQTYTNIEIVVVNDGSTDNSLNICKRFSSEDSRMLLIDKTNNGVSSARNAGLDVSKGDFIAFVDSDDWVEQDFIEILYKTLICNNVDISQCGYFFHKNNVISLPPVLQNSVLDKNQSLILLFEDYLVRNFLWNKLYKRSLFQNIRFPEGKNYEDVNVMYKLFDQCERIAYVNAPKYHYIFSSNSLMNNNDDLLSTGRDIFDSFLNQYKYARKNGLWPKGEGILAKRLISFISRIIRNDPNFNKYVRYFCDMLKYEVTCWGVFKFFPYQAFRRYIVLNHFSLFVRISKFNNKRSC